MAKQHLLPLLLLIALAASNITWALFYQREVTRNQRLSAELADANRQLDMLVKRVSELESNNTALYLQLRTLRERFERLAGLLETANETIRRALLVTSMLEKLNESVTLLFRMTFPHAFYSPMIKEMVKPGQVGDILSDTLGIVVFTREKALHDMEVIYNWTYREIADSPDQPFVAISDLKYVEMNGKKYVYGFTVTRVDNYIQDAIETLMRRAGDCEDKSILLTSLYLAYLGSFGDAWTVCVFGAEGYNHCFTVAYVKPLRKFVVADPTLGFYTVTDSVRSGIDQLFAFIGLRWSDVTQAIAFNNVEFQKGDLYTIIGYIGSIAG